MGFANLLLRLYRDETPRAVVVAWDTLEEETYRHEAFPAYQSGREFDDDIVEQLAVIPEFVTACGFSNARSAGYEADDFLAAAAAGEEKRRGLMLVASSDRNSFQLASPRTTVLYPVRGGGVERIGPDGSAARAFHRAARRPVRQIARRARRRPSRRSGADPPLRQPRGAAESRAFPKQAAELRLYKSIATMDRKAPLPKLPDQTPTWAKAAALARAWQLNALADRLDLLASGDKRRASG